MKLGFVHAVILASVLLLAAAAVRAETSVTIGTGDITGMYYPAGGAIAKIINENRQQTGIRVAVVPTDGSVANVDGVVNGDLQFGIVQSDCQYHALRGEAEWKDAGPRTTLRAVFSIYPESVTLTAAVDAAVKSMPDLKGKRVNLGSPGSDQRQHAIYALRTVSADLEKELIAENFPASEGSSLLQQNRIDAFFYTVGHPSGAIREATSGARKVSFVPIAVPDELLATYPYYTRSIIPIAHYPGARNDQDVETFGVMVTLVTAANAPDQLVYAVTKQVGDNLEEFKKLHPALAGMTLQSMLAGLTAPLHPGALQYFREKGLLTTSPATNAAAPPAP